MGGGRKADEAMDSGGKVEGFNVFRWMDRWAEGEKQMKQWIQEVRKKDSMSSDGWTDGRREKSR